MAKGGASGCGLPVREVLSAVLRHDGVAFALAHNHPGGDPTPTDADRAATRRVSDAAASVGLRLADPRRGDGRQLAQCQRIALKISLRAAGRIRCLKPRARALEFGLSNGQCRETFDRWPDGFPVKPADVGDLERHPSHPPPAVAIAGCSSPPGRPPYRLAAQHHR